MLISILCVHDIGHGDIDPDLEGYWSKVICDGLVAWYPDLQGAITCGFLKYDCLFEQVPINSFSCEHDLFEMPAKSAGWRAWWRSGWATMTSVHIS